MFENKVKAACKLHMADKSAVKDNIIAKIGTEPVSAHTARARSRFAALAACLALVLLIGMGGGIYYTVDFIKYNDAVSYLAQQGYSVENMTKEEIFKIYNNAISQEIHSSELQEYISDQIGEMLNNSSDAPSDNVGIKETVSATTGTSTSDSDTPKCNHTNVMHIPAVRANCITKGHWEYDKCADCDAVLTEYLIINPTGEHSYDSNNVCIYCKNKLDITSYLSYQLNEDGTGYVVTGFNDLPRDAYGRLAHLPELEIDIPATHNDLPITEIGEYAFRHKELTIVSVSLPDTVTRIGNGAFFQADLRSISLPRDLVYIGDYAFSETRLLTQITFNEKLEYIGSYAFNSVGSASGSNIATLTLPDSVTHIGESCFDGSNIYEIRLSAGLKKIPKQAFFCSMIRFAVIPEGVESIDFEAFARCSYLTEITLPSTLKDLNLYAFSNIAYYSDRNVLFEGTATVNIPSIDWLLYVEPSNDNPYGVSGTAITESIFDGEYCTLYVDGEEIPQGITVTVTEDTPAHYLYALRNYCDTLIIADGVTHIDEYAFEGFAHLTSIVISPSLKTVGRRAFENCENIKSVHITDLDAFNSIEFMYYEPFAGYDPKEKTSNPLYYGATLYLNGVPVE